MICNVETLIKNVEKSLRQLGRFKVHVWANSSNHEL